MSGKIRCGEVWNCTNKIEVWCGAVRYGTVRLAGVGLSTVWYGEVRIAIINSKLGMV